MRWIGLSEDGGEQLRFCRPDTTIASSERDPPLPDHPEIARNHIPNPGDIARQLLNRPATFR
jgi:hypothetical protein